MKALICKNCGGSINPRTLKCEYCGTQYKEEFADVPVRPLVIQSFPESIKVLATKVEVSEFMMRDVPPERIAEFTMVDIARSLAEALAPYIKLETERDPVRMTQVIRGTVRVVEPDFRF